MLCPLLLWHASQCVGCTTQSFTQLLVAYFELFWCSFFRSLLFSGASWCDHVTCNSKWWLCIHNFLFYFIGRYGWSYIERGKLRCSLGSQAQFDIKHCSTFKSRNRSSIRRFTYAAFLWSKEKPGFVAWGRDEKRNNFFAHRQDHIRHLLRRIIYGCLPLSVKIIILNIGTNDISYKDRNAKDVAEEIVYVCQRLYERKRSASILLTGILPGKGRPLWKVVSVNNCLNTVTIGNNYNMHYIPPTIKEWVGLKERVKSDLYASDKIRLS